jgi:uncharacterized membrane protein
MVIMVKVIKKYARRYFLDGFSYMTLGLFSSLIIGLIIGQMARIPGLSFLDDILTIGAIKGAVEATPSLAGYAGVLAANSPVIGAAIGVAVAYGLKHKPLVIFSSAAVGAAGYVFGGPLGCYISVLVGSEIGGLVAGKTKFDIVVSPLVTIIVGASAGRLTGGWVMALMGSLNNLIANAMTLQPIPMSIIISVVMGMVLTAPISSAALAISLGMGGLSPADPNYLGSALAAGAATVGCCANMIGFAVASFRENGWGGLVSQGLGTSMLQVPNIVRRPYIWLPAILSSAIIGPIATVGFKMTNLPSGAGMGTSGLVGQLVTWESMVTIGQNDPAYVFFAILLLHFILPAALTLLFSEIMRKMGIIKYGDMKLDLK